MRSVHDRGACSAGCAIATVAFACTPRITYFCENLSESSPASGKSAIQCVCPFSVCHGLCLPGTWLSAAQGPRVQEGAAIYAQRCSGCRRGKAEFCRFAAEKRSASETGADIGGSNGESRPNLRAPGAAEAPRRLSGRFEGGCSIFRCHSHGCLDVGQTASRCSSQYRGGRSFLIRELSNGHPIMVTKGQVPADKLTS